MLEVGAANDDSATAVIGMEAEGVSLLQVGVEEKADVMLLIIDETERRDAAWFETKVTEHPLGRSERQLAARRQTLSLKTGLQACLKVVDIKVMVAMEAYQVVLIALVIAHEDVLAMDAAIVMPPALRLLDGLALGMVVAGIWDVILLQKAFYPLLSF